MHERKTGHAGVGTEAKEELSDEVKGDKKQDWVDKTCT